MIRYAVFDLDKTITTKGTWGRFVSQSVRNKPWKLIGLWGTALFGQFRYKFGAQERVSVKRGMLRWSLAGQSRMHLLELAETFADQEIASGIRPGAIKEIRARQAAGDVVLIASAGADLVVEPIAKRLGIDHVISTKLGWSNDVCARDFATQNCYGPGKLALLQKYLETFPDYRRERSHITMYSDSAADLPAFEFADKGVAVNAGPRLRELAEVYDFESVDWSIQG